MAVVATFSGTSNVTVSTFDPATDQVVLDLSVSEIATVGQSGTSVVITSTSGFTLTIANTELAQLVQSGANTSSLIFLDGGLFIAGDGAIDTVLDPLQNTLTGTAFGDVLTGLGGNDTLNGGAGGSDLLLGGGGNDSITAGTTALTEQTIIWGGVGADTINGGTINGAASIYGYTQTGVSGDLADSITVGGGTGTVSISSGAGNDTIGFAGFAGSATVGGGADNDSITGAVAATKTVSVYGGLGADTISVDVIGTASIFGANQTGADGDLADSITLSAGTAAGSASISSAVGADTITFTAYLGSVTVGAGSDNDVVTGAVGAAETDIVYGGLGADSVTMTVAGAASIYGSNQTSSADDLGDTIALTGAGSIWVGAGYGADSITLTAVTGTSTVYGGKDGDTINVATTTTNTTVDGGNGADSIVVSADVLAGTGTFTLGNGADTITFTDGILAQTFTVTDYIAGKTVITDGAAISVSGTTVAGGLIAIDTGDDTITFNGALDEVLTIQSSAVGAGNFVRNGTLASVSITGTADSDTIIAGTLADTINSLMGNDLLDGRAALVGATYVFDSVGQLTDADTILGSVAVGGSDTVAISAATALTAANLIDDVDVFQFSGSGVMSFIMNGTEFGTAGIIDASGLTGTLALTGAAVADTISITGGTGADTINMALDTGSVTVLAGQGADSIVGGTAADSLVGGQGNDTYTGGALADTFSVTSGVDAITDLGVGSDILVVTAGASVTAVVAATFTATAATANAGSVTITMGAAATAVDLDLATGTVGYSVVGGAAAVGITGSDFADTISAAGSTGNVTIAGGAGADSMTGSNDLVGPATSTYAYGTLATVSAQTGITVATADTITNFVSADDAIKTGLAGAGVYQEGGVAVAGFTQALAAANAAMSGTAIVYSFQFDATNGYVFVDSNGDDAADAVIVLAGVNTAAGFDVADIIA